MSSRIFPRNLTARAAVQVAGNPVNTRLESSVGNCYPGLEFDHRNLDRRFFPGLVFEFVTSLQQESLNGARLVQVDLSDRDIQAPAASASKVGGPDATLQRALRDALGGDKGRALREGPWFLSTVEQGGKTIRFSGTRNQPVLDGITSWRLIRCLEPGKVTIQLERRPQRRGEVIPAPRTITLSGWRRVFVDADTGVIPDVYAAGELTQSLCSPWMHDFRDCACTYWASNHPDIVLSEVLPGEATLPSGAAADPTLANTPISWLRSERARESTKPALGTEDENRPREMDHYEINQRWQDLSPVLMGKEISRVFVPPTQELGNPFSSPDELAQKLRELAALEHTLALEYLYARYSLKRQDQVTNATLRDDLIFVRHEMLLIAVSEMRHLRWDNQIIWELDHAKRLTNNPGPALDLAVNIPSVDANGRPTTRPRALRPLTESVLADFIAVEQPSGFLEGQYSRVVATLRQPTYNAPLLQIAERIVADGVQHFSRFREINVVLRAYFGTANPPYLRNTLAPALPTDQEGQAARNLYGQILANLRAAYVKGDMEDARRIAEARQLMFDLGDVADALANRNRGVPYF
jgi:hypothetical protein